MRKKLEILAVILVVLAGVTLTTAVVLELRSRSQRQNARAAEASSAAEAESEALPEETEALYQPEEDPAEVEPSAADAPDSELTEPKESTAPLSAETDEIPKELPSTEQEPQTKDGEPAPEEEPSAKDEESSTAEAGEETSIFQQGREKLAARADRQRSAAQTWNSETLYSQIVEKLTEYDGDWSVFLGFPESGITLSVNNTPRPAASLIKLFVMGAVLDAMEQGTLSDNETNRGLMENMITWSSNDAWESLGQKLGYGNYNTGMQNVGAWCKQQGYTSSGYIAQVTGTSATSVEDVGLFLMRMLAGTNVSEEASDYMLSLMLRQQNLTKLPAGVPEGVITANKTGELDNANHDAAVIYAPFGTYVLVVMTENTTVGMLADLSSFIYQTLQS